MSANVNNNENRRCKRHRQRRDDPLKRVLPTLRAADDDDMEHKEANAVDAASFCCTSLIARQRHFPLLNRRQRLPSRDRPDAQTGVLVVAQPGEPAA